MVSSKSAVVEKSLGSTGIVAGDFMCITDFVIHTFDHNHPLSAEVL